MKIGGHGLSDHLRLLAPLFGFIAAVWALRMVLDMAAAPHGVVRFFSVSVAGALAVLIATLLVHFRRFGSYANIVASSFLLIFWEQVLVVLAIAFSSLTGTTNVYSAPHYSMGMSPARHIIGHLTFGFGIGGLFGAGMGCLLFWMLRRLVPLKASQL